MLASHLTSDGLGLWLRLSRPGFSEAEARAGGCAEPARGKTFDCFMLKVNTVLALALGFGEARATWTRQKCAPVCFRRRSSKSAHPTHLNPILNGTLTPPAYSLSNCSADVTSNSSIENPPLFPEAPEICSPDELMEGTP